MTVRRVVVLCAPVPVYPFVACEVDHPATVERRCTPYQLGVYTNLSVTGEPAKFWDCSFCTRVNNAQQDKCAACMFGTRPKRVQPP